MSIKRIHGVWQISGSSWYCAGDDNETRRGETPEVVGHFAQAINAEPNHGFALILGEMAGLSSLKSYGS